MQNLLILACGGTGREIRDFAKEEFTIMGFLDDNKVGLEIVGSLQDYARFTSQAKLCSALGSYRSMRRRWEMLSSMNIDDFVNVIAADSRIYSDATIGKGVVIFPHSVVSAGAQLGNHVFVYHNCVISHDSVVEDYSMLANSVTISGNVKIGKNCYIGAGATILEGLSIGDNTIIAAGATVVQSVGSNLIYIAKDRVKPNHYFM
jgi:sugar O-acyltransferase (sialic acid O-acetyltransferase NeuD family)